MITFCKSTLSLRELPRALGTYLGSTHLSKRPPTHSQLDNKFTRRHARLQLVHRALNRVQPLAHHIRRRQRLELPGLQGLGEEVVVD